jgi:hypothetical protein
MGHPRAFFTTKARPAMFTVYLDDSGTSPSQPIAIATGFVISTLQITRLEQEWEKFRNKYSFSDFSMAEFVAGNPKSEFAKWEDEKKKKAFQRIIQISKKFGTKAYSVAVNKRDYDDVIPDIFRNTIGRHHYTWAIHHLLSFLDTRWRSNEGGAPFEYVFHWMERESKSEIESAMMQAEESFVEAGEKGGYKNYSFRHSKDLPGLQCVDAICWVCYQYALFAIRNKPTNEFAEIGWRNFEGHLGEDGWLRAVTIQRPHLQDGISRMMADESVMSRLKKMQENRAFRAKR